MTDGQYRSPQCTIDGILKVAVEGGGGGGAGDASAANQATQIAAEQAIQAAVEGIEGQLPATLGSLTKAESLSICLASDQQPLVISGSVDILSAAAPLAVTGPLTDTELRATPVFVSGTFYQATQPVSGPLTDTELRANPVTVTDGGTPVYVDLANVSMSFVPTLDSQHLTPNGGTWLRQNPSAVAASAPHSGSIVSISRGYLRSLRVVYTGALASGLFVQLHSASSLTGLSSGTMLSMGIEINTGRKDISWDIPELLYYHSGLIAAFSTTQATYTATVQTGFAEAHYTA